MGLPSHVSTVDLFMVWWFFQSLQQSRGEQTVVESRVVVVGVTVPLSSRPSSVFPDEFWGDATFECFSDTADPRAVRPERGWFEAFSGGLLQR